MRTILATKCARRTHLPFVVTGGSSDADLAAWARAVIRDPQRYGATRRESAVIASLLADLEAGL